MTLQLSVAGAAQLFACRGLGAYTARLTNNTIDRNEPTPGAKHLGKYAFQLFRMHNTTMRESMLRK
jgi:hypothetical protein